MCTYIPSLVDLPPHHPIPPISVTTEHPADLPVPYCRCPLAVLHMAVHIPQSRSINSSHLSSLTWAHTPVLFICVSILALKIGSSVPFFLISTFFSFWLTSLCMTDSRSIYVSANNPILFLLYSWIIFHCICVPHLLYPFLCRWLFHVLLITNSAAMNIGVRVSFWMVPTHFWLIFFCLQVSWESLDPMYDLQISEYLLLIYKLLVISSQFKDKIKMSSLSCKFLRISSIHLPLSPFLPSFIPALLSFFTPPPASSICLFF